MTPADSRRLTTCDPHNNWWRGKDSKLRRREPADLQSAPVGRLGTPPGKNEPRILVSTPRSVNGIGATFATGRDAPKAGAPNALAAYIEEWSLPCQIPQPGPRLARFGPQASIRAPLRAFGWAA